MLKIYLGEMVHPRNAIYISDINNKMITANGITYDTYLSDKDFINVFRDHDNTASLEYCRYDDDGYIMNLSIFNKIDPLQIMIYYNTSTLYGLKLKQLNEFGMINSYRSLKISNTGIEVIINNSELNKYKTDIINFMVNCDDNLLAVINQTRELKKKMYEINKGYNEAWNKLNDSIGKYLVGDNTTKKEDDEQ